MILQLLLRFHRLTFCYHYYFDCLNHYNPNYNLKYSNYYDVMLLFQKQNVVGVYHVVQISGQIKHEDYEMQLTQYTTDRLEEIKGLKILGTAKDKGGVFAFTLSNIHPQDIAFVLGKEGVAVRTGHFCAEPLVNKLGYTSLTRASLGLYSTKEDVDELVKALLKAQDFLS